MSSKAERVPFLDVGATYNEISGELDEAAAAVLSGGWYVLGPAVGRFEEGFSEYAEASQCIGVASGLDALELCLEAAGIGVGDEVIVPSNTYIATWLAVSRVGATPVPAEPDPRTFNLDPSAVAAAVTSRTRAVIPVHLYGRVADVQGIARAVPRDQVLIFEDAAQAHGARGRSSGVGRQADAVAWSFYPGKNLGCFGDGGAVTTSNPELASAVRLRRNYGSSVKYYNEVAGRNSRLDELQAAMLSVKLRYLDEWNNRRRTVAWHYFESLANLEWLTLPPADETDLSCWHLYVVRTSQRDALQRHLAECGVDSMIHYPVPPHLQAAYASLGHERGSFPISEAIHDTVLSLPMGPHLTEAQQGRVVEAVRCFPAKGEAGR
jgi:dTDP-4-amino-4,6-dideoxygalactose transaminase